MINEIEVGGVVYHVYEIAMNSQGSSLTAVDCKITQYFGLTDSAMVRSHRRFSGIVIETTVDSPALPLIAKAVSPQIKGTLM